MDILMLTTVVSICSSFLPISGDYVFIHGIAGLKLEGHGGMVCCGTVPVVQEKLRSLLPMRSVCMKKPSVCMEKQEKIWVKRRMYFSSRKRIALSRYRHTPTQTWSISSKT